MTKKDKKIPQEKLLFGVGVGLLVVALAIIVFAFTFLANNALPAINPDDGLINGGEIYFDLEGFEKLEL